MPEPSFVDLCRVRDLSCALLCGLAKAGTLTSGGTAARCLAGTLAAGNAVLALQAQRQNPVLYPAQGNLFPYRGSGPLPVEYALLTLRAAVDELSASGDAQLSLNGNMLARGMSGQSLFPPEAVARLDQATGDLINLLDAIQATSQTARSDTTSGEEWLPAGKAIVRAEEAGYQITASWLSRDAAKKGVKVRPAQLPGRHKQEVEWNSLAGYLLRVQAASEESEEEDEEEISQRVRKAQEQKKRSRPLN
jgi:hypothetical protein